MSTSSSLISTIVKHIGKALLLILGGWLLLIAWIILTMKGVPPVLLVVYSLTALGCLAGLLWPELYQRWSGGRPSRAFVVKWFGVPATLLLVALYGAVVFYIQDLPVIFGLLGVATTIAGAVVQSRSRAGGGRHATREQGRRARRFGGAAVVCFALALISVPVVARYRDARFSRAALARQQAVAAARSSPPVQDGDVKVYPLHIGDAVVTYGQFYGGLAGWEGLRGYLQTLVNKDTFLAPIYAYLIDHPAHGLMLVDAGINWEQAHDHDGYYNHNYMVSRLLLERHEYRLATEQEIQVQLARLGYQPEAIGTIFVTHVHEDHVGGLRNFPHARVVVARPDWEEGVRYPYSFGLVADRLDLVAFDSGPRAPFPGSQDYFGDGSLLLLPTPGHSPGHMSIALQMDGYQILFVGDTPYTVQHLAVDQIRQLMLGGAATDQQVEAIRRTRHMLTVQPPSVLLFAHDTTDYQRKHIDPFLADGLLSADERQQIDAYVQQTFTADWTLEPGNHASYIRPVGSAETGSVGFR